MSETDLSTILAKLRESFTKMRRSSMYHDIVEPKPLVYERFRPLFAVEHLDALTTEDFSPFLYFETNHHWTGLHRQVNKLAASMPELRKALKLMLDESLPIANRLDKVLEIAPNGLGKAIMTAILHVAYPDKYGVWNSTSEGALATLGLYPEFERGTSFGEKYEQINKVFVKISKALDIDLWTLDALWWFIQLGEENVPPGPDLIVPPPKIPPDSVVIRPGATQSFGLERHLQNFLLDNWDQLELGRVWEIYTEPEDDQAGYEFACSVGRIDLLAKHRTLPRWLVIELKRSDTSDSVVGQAMRYMGWVKHHLAAANEEVHGLIIAREGDDSVRYAVSAVPNLQFMTYEVEFRLRLQGIEPGGGNVG